MTQLPSPQRRSLDPQHVKRVRPKTYSVAVYLVVAVILLQIVMLISVFWLRAMVVSVNVNLPRALTGNSGTPNPTSPATPGGPGNTPGMPRLPSLATTALQTALLHVPGASDQLAQIGILNEEAQVFLRQNDYPSASDLLIRAEDIDPRNPTTLKNLAEIYNLLNDAVKAREYWQRLVDLGEGVGTVACRISCPLERCVAPIFQKGLRHCVGEPCRGPGHCALLRLDRRPAQEVR